MDLHGQFQFDDVPRFPGSSQTDIALIHREVLPFSVDADCRFALEVGAGVDAPGAGLGELAVEDGEEDGYLVKLSGGDGQPNWALHLKGLGQQAVTALALGPSGELVAAGRFTDEVVLGDGGQTLTNSNDSGHDAFMVELDASTGSVIHSKVFGGSVHQRVSALAVDSGGNVYLAGHYIGQPDNPGAAPACTGLPAADPQASHVYVLRFGGGVYGECDWALVLGDDRGSGQGLPARLRDMALVGGDVWLTGDFEGRLQIKMPVADGAPLLEGRVAEDAWLAHFGQQQAAYRWWADFDGSSQQRGVALAGSQQRVLWAGTFDQEIDLGAGTLAGSGEAFLAAFDEQHGHRWSRAISGLQGQRARALAAADDGGIYLAATSTGDIRIADQDHDHTSGALILVLRLAKVD